MPNDEVIAVKPPIDRILAVFDRRADIPALDALISAIKNEEINGPLAEAAIALDANVVLRIPTHAKSADIIDYLSVAHQGPLILPGQVVQEFWNNQLVAVDTVAKRLQKAYEAFKKEADEIGGEDHQSISAITGGLNDFRQENEALFHPETVRRTARFLESLVGKATVPFAPRSSLYSIADSRKRAKTPPGFRDPGDGDFLVWSDLLFGLLTMKDQGVQFNRVILLSYDAKMDWCREGRAHPLLFAEARAVLGVDFEIWTLERFTRVLSQR